MKEAENIYRAIFKRPIPALLAERYKRGVEALEKGDSHHQYYQRLIQSTSDLEALEVAARLTGRLPGLTQRFQMMVYLAETLPEHHPYFINLYNRRLVGLLTLAIGTMKTVFLFCKGLWILRRLKNA